MTDYPTNPAENSGPNNDGSKSLAKESRWGLAVTFLLFAGAQGLVDALSNIDLNGQTGWWVSLANAGVATAIGTLTAWLKRNR